MSPSTTVLYQVFNIQVIFVSGIICVYIRDTSGSPGVNVVNPDWQNLREFHFPRKSGYTVRISGLKGRVSAGDYREETIVKVK